MSVWIWVGLIGIIVILVVLIFYLRYKTKKLKEDKINLKGIPPEVVEQFMEAERRMKTSRGEANPYKILWELNQERIRKEVGENETQERETFQGIPRPSSGGYNQFSNFNRGREQEVERDGIPIRDGNIAGESENIQPISSSRAGKDKTRNKPTRFNPI